ncbi:DNA replication/repair protein RecF [Megamonas hypermegale]|uniref:DNA replication/repair protein RecF n=1 Tax=Megamonas hypermegale TaxID=158847 RepID=UPI0026EF993C|nr:DNA replication/repair protein RecF [Megamonas hypermegale]
MNIKNIILHNYRNYVQLNIDLSPNINIFVGYNAQGKTNIIEAVHFAAIGISHRTRNDSDLIYWQKNEANINIKFAKMRIVSELKIILKKNQRKQLIFNGENIKQKELPGLLTMILFSPEDLMLIKGSPMQRRRFLDIELSQISLLYYNQLVQYNKILLQRNNLLKKIKENNKLINMLDMWDEQLAKSAAFIVDKRLKNVDKLNKLAQYTHAYISGDKERLKIKYNMCKNNINLSADIKYNQLYDWYINNLKKYRKNDIFKGSTSIGPHRDDIYFFINDIDLKSFGSQGQQRSAVLSLKLAELELLKNETGEYPVLLLDDVMSELDNNRRNSLLEFLQKKNIQTLITATDKSLFDDNGKNNFFIIDNGKVV